MQHSQSHTDDDEAHAAANESVDSTISLKEERDFARHNLCLQLAVPLSLSDKEIINKLKGMTIGGSMIRKVKKTQKNETTNANENTEKNNKNKKRKSINTASRAIANYEPAHLSCGQFLHWHVQHQMRDPQRRVYAARKSLGTSPTTVSRLFLNMLRTDRVVIKSNCGYPVFLAVVEFRDEKAPSRKRHIVRGFATRAEADKAICSSGDHSSTHHDVRHGGGGSEDCTLSELMDHHRPDWRSHDGWYEELGVEEEVVAEYLGGISIPRNDRASLMAEILGVSTEAVVAACRKSRAAAGLMEKKTLKEWRELKGVTIKDLSARSGVCMLSIKKYELGINPRLIQIRKALAKALSIGVWNVLWKTSTMKPIVDNSVNIDPASAPADAAYDSLVPTME